MSDCGASAKSLFLKRRVTRGVPTGEGLQKPFIWEDEIKMREKHCMDRAILDQKKGYKGGFSNGDRVRIQDTVAKGKQWQYLGNILEQTQGKDSFIVLLDSGDKIRRHKRFIRLAKGEKEEDDETVK